VFSFVETQLFTRLAKQYLSDEQYLLFQQALIDNPELVESEIFAGQLRVEANVAVTE
jgi:hypothetical protein